MLQRIKARWMSFRFRHVALEVGGGDMPGFSRLDVHAQPDERLDRFRAGARATPACAAAARPLRDRKPGPDQRHRVVRRTVRARIRDLRRKIQRGAVQAIVTVTVPEERQHENSYADVAGVSGADVSVPPGVTVELADDNANIPVTIHRVVERILPVRIDVTGDVSISQVKIEPTTVTVRGPKAILDRAAFLPTQPCSLQADADGGAGDPQARDQVRPGDRVGGPGDPGIAAFCAVPLQGRTQAEGV